MSTLTLTLPNNYVEIEQEEMMYLDGGMTATQKGIIIAACAAGAVAIAAALAFGGLAVVAGILKVSLGTLILDLGVAPVATVLIGALGITSRIATDICLSIIGK